jgi:hypothetical protein
MGSWQEKKDTGELIEERKISRGREGGEDKDGRRRKEGEEEDEKEWR